MLYALFYTLVPEFTGRRPPHRTRHLELVWEACARGEIVLDCEPTESEWIADDLLVFRDAAAARRFALGDPYVTQGLVSAWRIAPVPRAPTSAARPPDRSAAGS